MVAKYPIADIRVMRKLLFFLCLAFLPVLSGCAATDALLPHLRKPISWSDSSRQAQQAAYDRMLANSMGGTRNAVRAGMLGSSNYIPGASSNPFAP
jgi:hypothetical protein